MLIFVFVQRFNHVAFVESAALSESLIAALSRSNNTSASGRSLLSCASDFCAKTSSSDSVRGAAGGVAGVGGAGGAGGVVGAAGIGGGGGVTAGSFFPQPATARPKIRENAAIAAVREYTFIVCRSSIPLGEKV